MDTQDVRRLIETGQTVAVDLIQIWLPDGEPMVAIKEIAENLSIQNNQAVSWEEFNTLYNAHEFFFDCEGVPPV